MKEFPLLKFLPILTGAALIVGFYLTRKKDAKGAYWAAVLFTVSWSAVFVASLLNTWLNFGIGASMSAGTVVQFPFRWLFLYSLSPLLIAFSAYFLFPAIEEDRAMRAFRLLFYVVLPVVVALKFADSIWTRSTSLVVDTAPFFAALWWLRIRAAFPNEKRG